MDNKVYRSELTPVSFLRRSAYMSGALLSSR